MRFRMPADRAGFYRSREGRFPIPGRNRVSFPLRRKLTAVVDKTTSMGTPIQTGAASRLTGRFALHTKTNACEQRHS